MSDNKSKENRNQQKRSTERREMSVLENGLPLLSHPLVLLVALVSDA